MNNRLAFPCLKLWWCPPLYRWAFRRTLARLERGEAAAFEEVLWQLGQLSSPRVFGQGLLARGPSHPLPTVAVGQADSPEQVLLVAEAEILQPPGAVRVLRAETGQHGRKQGAVPA